VVGLVDNNKIKINNTSSNQNNFISLHQTNNYNDALNEKSKSENEIIVFEDYGNGDVVDQQQTKNSYSGWGVVDTQWIAQGFTPSLEVLTRVQLYMFKIGTVYGIPITVSIRESLNGNDLISVSVDAGELGDSPWWIEFDFENISVIPGNKYYIVAGAPEADDYNCPVWNYYPNNPYKGGDAWIAFSPEFNWVLLDFPPTDPETDCMFKTYGLDDPPNKPTINGTTAGKIGTEYNYTFATTDPEAHDIYYYINWGDNTNSGWIGPYSSGQQVTLAHSWDKSRKYVIKAKANDTYGAESPWGTLEITIPRNKAVTSNMLLLRLLERFPLIQKLLLFIE
jgi:hypothetical protein